MRFEKTFCERVHAASLRLLNSIGVKIDQDEIRDLVLKAGARPGNAAHAVRLPPEMVAEKLALAPSQAIYADRHFNRTALGPEGPATFWTGAALNIREGRSPGAAIQSGDLLNIARVIDRLDNVFAITGTSMADKAPETRDFSGFHVMARGTRKHLRPLMFTKTGVTPIIEMAEVLLDGRKLEEYPIFSLGYSILSPFHWSEIPLSMWYLSRGRKIPVMINGEPIAGASSPMTLAGSITQSNAEILSGIVINQILEPGRPCVYNLGFAHAMDMKTMLCLSGSPECALMAEAGGHLARFYRLPSASWMATDAIYGGHQAAAERMMTGLVHAQAGTNVIWGVGQLETQKAVSLTQCVLDNDSIGYIQHYLKGFDTSDTAMAVEEILAHEFSGTHMESDFTFDHFREVLHHPAVFNRRFHNSAAAPETQDADEAAERKVAEYLQAPPEETLTAAQTAALDDIERRWTARMTLSKAA